jgi:CubicO group peptidase (beta-lactamase class C family)
MMTRRLFSYTVLLVLLLAPLRLVAQNRASLPPDKLKKVEAVISSEMSRQKIPAVSVAIVTNNQLQWSNGYGLADIENSVPAKASTAYRLASVSKPITAVAALLLVERGRLDLDAPVQKYCPAFPQKQWTITARQLLAHTSGIRHYQSLEEVLNTRHYNSLVEALDIFKNDPLLFEPGAKFSYTTFGYVLLGCVIEGASGMKYAGYIRENISRPSGMANLRVDDVYAIIPHRAQGYSKTASGELQNSALADTSNKIPAGGLSSTVEDLAQFAVALQTGKLLKQETVRQMWLPQKTRDGQATGGGLGWALTERNSQREIWHDGGQQRVSTILYLLPDKGFAVAIMTNLEDVKMLDFARQIADAMQ